MSSFNWPVETDQMFAELSQLRRLVATGRDGYTRRFPWLARHPNNIHAIKVRPAVFSDMQVRPAGYTAPGLHGVLGVMLVGQHDILQCSDLKMVRPARFFFEKKRISPQSVADMILVMYPSRMKEIRHVVMVFTGNDASNEGGDSILILKPPFLWDQSTWREWIQSSAQDATAKVERLLDWNI